MVVEPAKNANHSSLFKAKPGQPGKVCGELELLIVAQYPSKSGHRMGAVLQVFPGSGNPGGGQVGGCADSFKIDKQKIRINSTCLIIASKQFCVT